MSEQPKGRKKHLVEGEVNEVKKGEQGLGLGSVSKKTNVLSSIFNSLTKSKKGK